jgi:hypothetical protein
MRPVMRKSLIFAGAPLATVLGLAWACSNSNGNPVITVGNEASVPETSAPDTNELVDTAPIPDATNNNCTLSNNSDPVALCFQQQFLGFELQYAYAKGQGVAPSWSSVLPWAASTAPHDWTDDLGLAGALGAYFCSAEVYGNNASNSTFLAALTDVGAVLTAELKATPPTGYDGETYFRLRWAQAAFNFANDSAALTVTAAAEAFGAGIASQVYAVPASGGGSDGGTVAEGGDAGEAGSTGTPGGLVIGTKNGDGTVSYSPAKTIMAAAAVLDMAVVHVKDADAGTTPVQWANTAVQVLDYVLARGRDTGTGLFYQSLVTSGDPGHDTPGPGTPTSDTFLLEDQAWVTMGLTRAQDLLETLATDVGDGGADGGGLDASITVQVYAAAGADLAGSVAKANLFDGTTSPPSPPPVGAFMEGVGPAGLLTNKTTIGNAIMLGALHRIYTQVGTSYAYELGEVRSALLQLLPANSSLMSVVADQSGNANQQAYLRAASKSFGYAVAYAPDGGSAGQEPGATDYRPSANHAMVEGITQLWHGSSEDARCAP